MRGNSDNYPKVVSKSAGKFQICYDIEKVEKKSDIDVKGRISYDYSYVEIVGELTKPKIINAIIADVYSSDAEIALINNELLTPGMEEYKEYQRFRVHAKEVAGIVELELKVRK